MQIKQVVNVIALLKTSLLMRNLAYSKHYFSCYSLLPWDTRRYGNSHWESNRKDRMELNRGQCKKDCYKIENYNNIADCNYNDTEPADRNT